MFFFGPTTIFVLACNVFLSQAALVPPDLRAARQPAKADDVLSITLSNAKGQSVKSIDDLRLSAKVTNVGGAPIKVVKFGGIWNGSPTQSFIVRKGGEEVKFVGIIVRASSRGTS